MWKVNKKMDDGRVRSWLESLSHTPCCHIKSWILIEHDKYEKRLLLRCIHQFKSDLIKYMDHMRISGTEPSSVIIVSKTFLS